MTATPGTDSHPVPVTKTDIGLGGSGLVVAAMGAISFAVDNGYLDQFRELARAFPNPVTALIACAGFAFASWNYRSIRRHRIRIVALEHQVRRLTRGRE